MANKEIFQISGITTHLSVKIDTSVIEATTT
jgi:hypothetical protein